MTAHEPGCASDEDTEESPPLDEKNARPEQPSRCAIEAEQSKICCEQGDEWWKYCLQIPFERISRDESGNQVKGCIRQGKNVGKGVDDKIIEGRRESVGEIREQWYEKIWDVHGG